MEMKVREMLWSCEADETGREQGPVSSFSEYDNESSG
jgi:hypothetical protein